jgi:hypothetical protein
MYKGGSRAPIELIVSQQHSSSLLDPSEYPALPASVGVVTTGQVVLGVFGAEKLAHDLSGDALYDVEVIHRWLKIKGPIEPFGYMEIRFQGRTYDCGRSAESFFGTLALVIAAPVIAWTLFALPFAIRTRRKGSSPDAAEA